VDKGFWWLLGGIVLLASLGGGSVIALAAWQRSANGQKWKPYLDAAGEKYGLPADLVARLSAQESIYFDQDVIDGTRPSPAGALGIMQLMPRYFSTVRRPVPFTDQDTIDQIDEGAQQLATLYRQLSPLAAQTGQNIWALVLAGYNAGAQAVKNAGGVPPYDETQNYVAKILADVPAAVAA
jgi:soluble lytic murein transglycosylase-like protein